MKILSLELECQSCHLSGTRQVHAPLKVHACKACGHSMLSARILLGGIAQRLPDVEADSEIYSVIDRTTNAIRTTIKRTTVHTKNLETQVACTNVLR